MGRRAIQDGLVNFRQWLVDHELLSPSTARSYTSHVRTALGELGEGLVSDEAVADHFDRLHRDKPFTYNNTKRGWVLFQKWARDERGVQVASPGNAKSKLKNTLDPLPKGVRMALLDIMAEKAIPLSHVSSLTWGDVEVSPFKTQADVRVPGRRAEYWRVDKSLLEPLRAYAQVEEQDNPEVPLVPVEPGGLEPYSYRALRKEVKEARKEARTSPDEVCIRVGPPMAWYCSSPKLHDPPTPGTAEADHFPTRTDADLAPMLPAPKKKAPGVPPGMEPGKEPDWWRSLSESGE